MTTPPGAPHLSGQRAVAEGLSGERGTSHLRSWVPFFSAEHFLKLGFGLNVCVPLAGPVRLFAGIDCLSWVNARLGVSGRVVAFSRSGVRVGFPVLGAS